MANPLQNATESHFLQQLSSWIQTIFQGKKKAYLAALAAFVLYVAITFNAFCSSFPGSGGFAFASARLTALLEVFWFLLPFVWLAVFFKFGRLWLKIISIIAMLFVALSTVAELLWVLPCIVNDVDCHKGVIDVSKVDSRTDECLYQVSPCLPYGLGRIGCTETKLLPGIIWVKVTERASLDDYWVPQLQMR